MSKNTEKLFEVLCSHFFLSEFVKAHTSKKSDINTCTKCTDVIGQLSSLNACITLICGI